MLKTLNVLLLVTKLDEGLRVSFLHTAETSLWDKHKHTGSTVSQSTNKKGTGCTDLLLLCRLQSPREHLYFTVPLRQGTLQPADMSSVC